MRRFVKASAVVIALCSGTAASAAIYNAPVASNAYITVGNLDWAWASPVDGTIDLSYQSQFGWRFATAAELLLAPLAQAFQFVGANVTFGGSDPVSGSTFQYTDASLTGDAACAAAYFSTSYSHCDWGNGPGTLNGPVPWAGQPGSVWYSETLVVRDVAPVPVPASLGLLAMAIGSFFGLRRRRGV